jgi:hypothetical protein
MKSGGPGGGWAVRLYWAHYLPSLSTITAQLLGQPATGEPYIILIMTIFAESANSQMF